MVLRKKAKKKKKAEKRKKTKVAKKKILKKTNKKTSKKTSKKTKIRRKKGITKGMKLSEVMAKHPETIEVFFKSGMSCIGCSAAIFETIEQGAKAHGFTKKNVEDLIKKLNEVVKKKKLEREKSEELY